SSIPAPIVDGDRCIFALLAGGPRDPRWKPDVADEAASAMEKTARELFGEPHKIPRRGPYHAETVGVSMGGGQEHPMPFFHTVTHALLMAQLLAIPAFQRIAGFTNSIFLSFAPRLHEYYRSTMEALYKWDKTLPWIFDLSTSVFAAATFNFGPRTVTLPHLDFANLAWGWCAITALGNFDPNKGGHLILWDLRLVIRFPPGCTILIPSAIVRHSNVSIQQGEQRFSFTQYTAAGIFRFVYNGFRTEKAVKCSQMTMAEKAKRAEERKRRWVEGLKMYSKWDVAFE
ncbi:hypothetical protein B0H15DRAFT_789065, partial [Mycena belliarum]